MFFLGRFNRICKNILLRTGVVMLVIFVIAVLMQVFSRNVLKMAMDWTAEVSVFCFVWSVFLGAAIAVSSRLHYVVDLFPPKYMKINMLLIIVSDILIMGFILALFFGGSKFAMLGWRRLSTALEISRFWLYVSMPVNACFMFIFNLENLLLDLRDFAKQTAVQLKETV